MVCISFLCMGWKETSFYPKEDRNDHRSRLRVIQGLVIFVVSPKSISLSSTLGRGHMWPSPESRGLFVVFRKWGWLMEGLRTGQPWPQTLSATPGTLGQNKLFLLLAQKRFYPHGKTLPSRTQSNIQGISYFQFSRHVRACAFFLTRFLPALPPLASRLPHLRRTPTLGDSGPGAMLSI